MFTSMDTKIIWLDRVDSTQNEVRRRIEDREAVPLTVISRRQTAGRGRMGRTFVSDDGGLYFTLGVKMQSLDVVGLTCRAAVALCDAIRDVTGIDCGIKWVNDLIFNGKKVAGILCESFVTDGERYVLIGVGVNCTNRFDGTPLQEIATSLGRAVDVIPFVRAFLDRFETVTENNDYLDVYRQKSVVLGKTVSFTEGDVTHVGQATAIDGTGALLVQTEEGTVTLNTGEISVRLV